MTELLNVWPGAIQTVFCGKLTGIDNWGVEIGLSKQPICILVILHSQCCRRERQNQQQETAYDYFQLDILNGDDMKFRTNYHTKAPVCVP